tara:strand:+ start:2008 stop:3741 length:1734 start_codon:yes stop_codon:yes gene_type:complete
MATTTSSTNFRPNIKTPPVAPMGPYRSGKVADVYDFEKANEAFQDSVQKMGVQVGTFMKLKNQQKASLTVDGMNAVKGESNENIQSGVDAATDFGSGTQEYNGLDKAQQQVANGRIQNLGVMRNTAQKMITDFGASEELTDENINWFALNGNQDVAKFLDEVTTGNGEFKVDFPKHSKSWNDIQNMESGFLKFRKNKAKKQQKAVFANQNTMPEFVMNDGTRITQAELQQAQTLFKATKEQRADFDDNINDLYDNLFKELKDNSADKGYTYGMTRKDQYAQLQKRSLEESENIINSIGGSYGYIYANMMKGDDGKVNGSVGRYLSDTPTEEEKAAVQAYVQEKILNKLPNSLRPEQNLEDKDDANDWKQFGLGSNPSGSKPIFDRVQAIVNIPMETVGVETMDQVKPSMLPTKEADPDNYKDLKAAWNEGGTINQELKPSVLKQIVEDGLKSDGKTFSGSYEKYRKQVYDAWFNKFGKMARPKDADAAKKLLQITSLNKEFDGNKIVQDKVDIVEIDGIKQLVIPVITDAKNNKGKRNYINLEDEFALKDLFRNFSGISDDENTKSTYESIYDFFNQ